MTYRLVALDLDGTLLDSQLQIRTETIDALSRLRAQGIQAMIVTGRHHVAAYPYWQQLGLDLPAAGGGLRTSRSHSCFPFENGGPRPRGSLWLQHAPTTTRGRP